VEGAQVHRHDLEALALHAGDHVTDQAALDSIGLDQDKSAHGHLEFSFEQGSQMRATNSATNTSWPGVLRRGCHVKLPPQLTAPRRAHRVPASSGVRIE